MSIEEDESNICFRGERRFAERIGDDYVIEGDILVGPTDRWCHDGAGTAVSEGGEPIAAEAHATRIQGNYKWTQGRVPFEIDAAFPTAEKDSIEDAMAAWEDAVPGLDFVAKQAADVSWIKFKRSTTSCNSSLGRTGVQQDINLTSGCALSQPSVQHELAHALGMDHEQNRHDRASFVTINWPNVIGCLNSATSIADCTQAKCSASAATASECACPATLFTETDAAKKQKIWQACTKAHNFYEAPDQADIGAYNYASVMHYNATSFMKPGLPAGSMTMVGPVGQVLGGATALSAQDARNMQAMYPVLETRTSVFASVGVPTRICDLRGRENDAATKYRVMWPPTSPTFTFDGYTFTTTASQTGVFTRNLICEVQSYFWGGTYAYPNSSTAVWNTAASGKETFSTSVNTVVMTAGLAPIFL